MNKIFSIQEVADILGVSTKTLRRWEEKGVFVPHRTPGNQRRYTQEQIENFKRQRNGLAESPIYQVPVAPPSQPLEKTSPDQTQKSAQYWTEELVKSILIFKKLAIASLFIMLFVAVVGVGAASLKSANLLNLSGFPKVLSLIGINKSEPKSSELSEVLRTGGKAVLGAGTESNNLVFGVKVQSEFADSAQFLDTIKVAGIATLSGGVITENQDVNAGTGKLTASNVLYGAIGGDGITVGPGQTPIITNTGVLSLTAGSGISVGTGTKPTISNTGVLSLGGSTGALTLKAGTGIAISGLTITNNDLGTSQNIFKTIAVTGSTSIAASSNTDTLTFEAGTGITLATNTLSKKVTITGAGAGGWQENNGALSPSNITDDLLLGGISTSTAKFAFINVVGSGTPTASVSANSGNNAAFLTGTGNLQTTNSQTLTLGGGSTGDVNLSIGASNNLRISGAAGANVTASCVTTTNGIVTASGTCPVASNWDVVNGVITPKLTSTLDFLLGSQSSASAKFAVLNINSGTPIASISANSGNNATVLTGLGVLSTVNGQTLTLGDTNTGNIVLTSAAASTYTIGAAGTTGTITLGSSSATNSVLIANGAGATTLNLANVQVGGAVNIGAAMTSGTITIGGTGLQTGTITFGGGTGAQIVNLGTGGTGIKTVNLATGTAANVIAIGGGAGTLAIDTGDWDIGTTGNATGLGNITADGTITFSTFNANNNALYATVSTGVLAGASTNTSNLCLLSGATAPAWGTCDTSLGSNLWNQSAGALYPNNSTVDLLVGGTTSASAKFAVLNVAGSLTPVASVSATTASGGSGTGLVLSGAGSIQSLLNATLTLGGSTTGGINFTPGNIQTAFLSSIGRIGMGTVTNPIGLLNISGSAGNNAALIVNQSGSNSLDDIFTASAAGTTKFTVNNSGDLLFSGTTRLTNAGVGTFTSGTVIGSQTFTTNNIADSGALTIATGANADLTLTPNGTGNIVLTGDFNSQVLIGATSATTEFPLFVNNGIGNNAVLAINNPNSGDLFTASASGTTKFTIANNGNLQFAGSTSFLTTLTSAATAARTITFPDATGTICVSGSTCATSGTVGYWNQSTLGTLFPGNSTVDLLVGGTTSASAKFAVLNINSGTPTASVSAGTAGGAYLSATGTLATTAKQTLTLGGADSGELILQSRGATVFKNPTAGANQSLFIGEGAGASITTAGLASVGIGYQALNALTSGASNTALGYQALNANTTASFNTAVGNGALKANTTGGQNTAVGYQALNVNTTGANNTAMGSGALALNTTGASNTALGNSALFSNTTGASNTALGYQALNANTTANFNTAMGSGALALNTTGLWNTALGYQALNANISGNQNTAVGYLALLNNTGDENTALGNQALRNNTANGNTAVGFLALFNNIGGTLNTVLGYQALYANTTGSNNTAVGNQAGYGAPVPGLYANTTGSNNTFLGYNSSPFSATQRNNMTAVGAFSVVDQANSLVLGGLGFYAVNVGIGTATPSAVLDIQGGQRGGNAALIVNQTGVSTNDIIAASASGTLAFRLTNGGNASASAGFTINAAGSLQTTNANTLTIGGNTTGELILQSRGATVFKNPTAGANQSLFIGEGAGASITAGSLASVGIGYQALNALTSGTFNTAVGYNALQANITGAQNTAVGLQALQANTTAIGNTALGYRTLEANTTGTGNTALGRQALFLNITGTNNTAVGDNALLNNTGASNTAVGYQALNGNSTGSSNTALGYQAGFTNTGQYSITTGSNNVYLGYNAGPWTLAASFNNSTAIGAYALVNASNSLVLGGTAFYAVNVGIGTATPSAVLDIQGGNMGGRSALIVNQTGASTNDIFTASASGTTRFVLTNSGGVGINAGANNSTLLGTLDLRPNLTNGGTISIASVSGATSFAGLLVDNTGVGNLFTASKSGATKFVIANNGNLQFAGQTNFLTTLASAATAARTITFPDSTGTICVSGSTCATSGTVGYWNQSTLGTLFPGNSTVDLLIGGITTASAKFAVLNINSGTPTASVSAGTAGGASLTATGFLATTAKQTLTLGDTNTGEVVLAPGGTTALTGRGTNLIAAGTLTGLTGLTLASGGITLGGTAGAGSQCLLGGATAAWGSCAAGAGSNWDIVNGVITPKLTSTLDFLVGSQASSSAKFAVLNINSGTPTASISANSGNNAAFLTGLGVLGTTNAQTLTLGNSSTGEVLLAPGGTTALTARGTNLIAAGTLTGLTGLTLASGGITLGGTAGSSAQCLLGGATAAWGSCAAGAGSNWDVVNGVITPKLTSTLDFLLGSQASASAKFAVLNINSGTPTASISAGTAGGAYLSATGTLQTTANQTLTLGGNTTGNIILPFNAATKVGIGTALPLAGLDIRGMGPNFGTTAIASISGKTSFAGLLVDNSGVGDIFTASASGATRFRMTNNGSVLFQGDTLASIGTIGAGTPSISNNYAVVNAIGDQGGMVPNASFESAIGGLTFADGWVTDATSSATTTFSRDTTATNANHGDASAKVVINNGSGAFYSSCIPVGGGTQYNTRYYVKATAPIPTLRSYLDLYTNKANCQANTSVTISDPGGTALTTSWAATGFNVILSAGISWIRVHFFIACDAGAGPCASSTVNIDGVRIVQSSTSNALDYAENYPADPARIPEAGDVVSLTSANGVAQVAPAEKYMDQGAIGVVSTEPGYLLGDSVPDPKVPVALAGRVPVKVSGKNGKIYIGDYLASSDIPGVAVRAITAGPVIGTAMENYTDPDPTHTGKVTMFIKNTYLPFAPVSIGVDGNLSSFSSPVSSEAAALALGLPGVPEINQPINQSTNQPISTNSASFDLAGNQLFKDLQNRVASVESQIEDLRSQIINSSTQSAFLSSITSESAVLGASDSAEFISTLKNATIEGDLNVLGRTTVTDLGVTGNIASGLLSIHGLDSDLNGGAGGASINSVGDLNLQNNGLGGINILSGKVTIDTQGNIKTAGEITAKKVNIQNVDHESASIGSSVIKAGDTSVTISTTAVTDKSKILVTPTTKTGNQVLVVSNKSAGTGFTITIESPYSRDIKFDWWIVDEK